MICDTHIFRRLLVYSLVSIIAPKKDELKPWCKFNLFPEIWVFFMSRSFSIIRTSNFLLYFLTAFKVLAPIRKLHTETILTKIGSFKIHKTKITHHRDRYELPKHNEDAVHQKGGSLQEI